MSNTDRQIGISAGYLAGPGAGLAMMAAPDYLHLHPATTVVCFWVGIAVFFLSILHVSWVSYKEKARRKVSVPLILMAIGALLLFIGALWNFWPANQTQSAGSSVADTSGNVPPIASLQYVVATLIIEIQKSTGQSAGQIKVEIKNDTDKVIFFQATTAGNINNLAFEKNKVQFEGFINPRQSSYLLSNRIVGFRIENAKGLDTPSVRGIFEYDIKYRFVDATEFLRETSKGIEFLYWSPVNIGAVGTTTKTPITVRLYDEKEK